jgi:hypothetical protein
MAEYRYSKGMGARVPSTGGAPRVKNPEHQCGGGGGPLMRLADVAPDQKRPTTNADVWLAEGGANALYSDDSPICAACWMAYLAAIDKWSRSLADPARFKVPLSRAIREFPVPERNRPTVVYNQLYGAGNFNESVGFWCQRDESFLQALQDYAEANNLALDLEPGPPGKQDQVLISASHTRRV